MSAIRGDMNDLLLPSFAFAFCSRCFKQLALNGLDNLDASVSAFEQQQKK